MLIPKFDNFFDILKKTNIFCEIFHIFFIVKFGALLVFMGL